MRYLSIAEVVELHSRLIHEFGGSPGLHSPAALESAVAQPLQTFAGDDLYVGVVAKAAALGFFLATGHAFVDGNKRIGHAAVAVTLLLNGFTLVASIEEQESVMLRLASGKVSREQFIHWVEEHVRPSGA